MTVSAACPFCKVGQVYVSRSEVGETATCPKCLSSFRVAKFHFADHNSTADDVANLSGANPTSERLTEAVEVPKAAPTAGSTSTSGRRSVGSSPLTSPSTVGRPPAVVPHTTPSSGMPMVWGALLCAGLVLPATYVPGGRLLALLLSLIGWALGSLAFLGRLKSVVWPTVAAGLNLVLMLTVMLLPTWLGLGPWLPTFGSTEVDDQTVRMVPYQGKGLVTMSDGWIDANVGGWQRGDLRVTLSDSWLGPILLEGPQGKTRSVKEPVILIKVRVANVGAAREIEFRGWRESAEGEFIGPTLTDSQGRKLNLREIEKGWRPQGQPPQISTILPGASVEQWLVFDAPQGEPGELRLELPTTSFGEQGEPIRLRFTTSRGQDGLVNPSPSKR